MTSEKNEAEKKDLKKATFNQNRSNASLLVVCNNGTTSNQIRQALKTLGFTKITAAATHVTGLDRIKGRNFPLVIFDGKETDMPTVDFVKQVLTMDENTTMIALSGEPRVDDVFGLLRNGARGFLALPFTVDSLEEVLGRAQDGPPLSDAVLNSPDRNAALVGVILNNLYRLSVLMRQAREFATAKRELERQSYSFAESVELAKLFCEGGDDNLLEKIVEGCINRANTAATRLGRTRKKLKKEREKQGGDAPTAAAAR